MRRKTLVGVFIRNPLLWSVLLATLLFQPSIASAQGTAFTYQGRLNDGGTPANGTNYSLVFSLYDASTNGDFLGSAGFPNVALTNGLFTVALDFGDMFNGGPRWLGVAVQKNNGGITNLWPRQKITATPYAILANRANTASSATNLLGSLPVAQLTGIVPLSQLPGAVVTNGENGLNLAANGNIGIGTATPQQRLSVAGTVESTTGGFKFPDGSVQTYAEPWVESGNSIYFTNGGVAIGTTTPTAQLDVVGTVRATTFNGNGLVGWQTSSNSQSAFVNAAYIATNNLSQVVVALPASASYGNIVAVAGGGAAGWKIAQNSGQTIWAANLAGNIGTVWSAQNSGNQNWSAVVSSADGTRLAAAINGNKIYISNDSGASWTPEADNETWTSVASSSDGTKLVAAASGGQIFISSDSGLTWTPEASGQNWQSVASSADGTKLVAAVNGGLIYTSTDSGTNWTARTSGIANSGVQNWRSVGSSADGTKLVAAADGGGIYTSTDSGASWTGRIGGNWYSVASSADGTKLVAAVNGGLIYTSTDSGANWTARATSHAWQSVASSADGTRLVAVVNGGQIYTSADSGATWTARATSQNWAAVASSADGTKLLAAVSSGQLFTSHPVVVQSTTLGTSGYLAGGQNTAVRLLYVGNGQWMPISHEGSIAAY